MRILFLLFSLSFTQLLFSQNEQVVVTEEYVIEALQRGPQSLLANSILPSSGKAEPAKSKDDDEATAKPEKGPSRQKRDSAWTIATSN